MRLDLPAAARNPLSLIGVAIATAMAERAVDNAMALGQIPRDLPFARREAVAALKTDYASRDAAFAGIEAKLLELHRPRTSDSAALAREVKNKRG